MNYALIVVIYMTIMPGTYMKKELKTWPLTLEVCFEIGERTRDDPKLNSKTSYVETISCIPMPDQVDPDLDPEPKVKNQSI